MGLSAKAKDMTEEQKEKLRGLSQGDIPIQQRRAYYNAMNRRIKAGNLKPGLVEKYNSACSSRKERFNLLKEFLIDENMFSPQSLFKLTHFVLRLSISRSSLKNNWMLWYH